MKTIKIIDLLNKIANGEKVPKKLKYKIHYWEYREERKDYKDNEGDNVFCCSNYDIPEMLNNEAEIIEEDKQENEIQLIEYNLDDDTLKTFIKGKYVFVDIPEDYRYLIDFYKNKINEIIDVVNKGE